MRTRDSDHLSNERAPLCRTAPSPCNSTAAEAPPRALASQSRRGIDQSQPTTPCQSTWTTVSSAFRIRAPEKRAAGTCPSPHKALLRCLVPGNIIITKKGRTSERETDDAGIHIADPPSQSLTTLFFFFYIFY